MGEMTGGREWVPWRCGEEVEGDVGGAPRDVDDFTRMQYEDLLPAAARGLKLGVPRPVPRRCSR